MRRIATITAMLLVALLTPLLVTAPASAQKVHVDDASGDEYQDYYDINRLEVDHRPDRVRIKLEQDGLPYVYEIRVDVPGRHSWDYMVIWDVYTPHNVTVETRHQYQSPGSQHTCQPPTAGYTRDSSVLKLKFMRSCLGNPRSLRMRADANDDQFCEPCDTTRWTPWAHRA